MPNELDYLREISESSRRRLELSETGGSNATVPEMTNAQKLSLRVVPADKQAGSFEVTGGGVGAGSGNTNGVYTERGTEGGKPYYNLVNQPDSTSANAVVWAETWVMLDKDGLVLFQGTEDLANPWMTTFLVGGDGYEPAPTLVHPAPNLIDYGDMVKVTDVEGQPIQILEGSDPSQESSWVAVGQPNPNNATVPDDAPIQPPQAFVDAVSDRVNLPSMLSIAGFFQNKPITYIDFSDGNLIASDYSILGFYGCALNLSTVNGGLEFAVAGGNSGGTFDFSGGTNAEPTDGVDNADIATLVSNGWTVTVNIGGVPTTFAP